MVIDQRNAGNTVNNTTSSLYTLDRWQIYGTSASKFRIAQGGAPTPLAGFSQGVQWYSLAATSVGSSDLYIFRTKIEGFNTADFSWGTASAKAVTLSFWVYSSLTGTFGGAFGNNNGDRSYPFTYTINSANTWEQKTITVAGDTSGTWDTTTGIGLAIVFSLGAGSTFSGTAGAWASANYYSASGTTNFVSTNAATLYITGVQLEKGATATAFDYRPYGTELALCQRYFVRMGDGNSFPVASAQCYSTTGAVCMVVAPQPMRATPTLSHTNMAMWTAGTSAASVTSLTLNNITVNAIRLDASVASGLVAGDASFLNSGSSSGNIQLSAEL